MFHIAMIVYPNDNAAIIVACFFSELSGEGILIFILWTGICKPCA